jgi:selenocysteine lyase/cysteine desulfurase
MTTASLSLDAFRDRFPILKQRVYVNNCSQGALSEDVEAAFAAYLTSWREHGSPWDTWVETVERLRCRFAGAIGADADEVAIMPSASVAISSLATALTFEPPRQAVVIGDLEFPTMAHVWLAQRRRGAVVRWVRAVYGFLSPDAYAEVVREDTVIVPVTHVCFKNGFRTDVPGVTKICHDRGAYVLLDDYQRTGSAPIDVHALGVDFMVTGCLKYLLGPAGLAFLYVRRDLIEHFEPLVTGWFGRVNPFAFSVDQFDWAASAARFESGTPEVPNAYGALAGVKLLDRVGLDVVERQVAHLVERFASAATQEGFVVRTPADPARRGPLVVLQSRDAATLVARLIERGVIGSSRGDAMRISFHAYNNDQDVDAVMDALRAEEALLARVDARVEV